MGSAGVTDGVAGEVAVGVVGVADSCGGVVVAGGFDAAGLVAGGFGVAFVVVAGAVGLGAGLVVVGAVLAAAGDHGGFAVPGVSEADGDQVAAPGSDGVCFGAGGRASDRVAANDRSVVGS